jgi:chitin disaccharide deacetylase
MSPRCLIINADDFGFTPGVTEGIVQAFQEGILTTTSAMINMPNAPERIARARARHPDSPSGCISISLVVSLFFHQNAYRP